MAGTECQAKGINCVFIVSNEINEQKIRRDILGRLT